jgi:hypothetical protein
MERGILDRERRKRSFRGFTSDSPLHNEPPATLI